MSFRHCFLNIINITVEILKYSDLPYLLDYVIRAHTKPLLNCVPQTMADFTYANFIK